MSNENSTSGEASVDSVVRIIKPLIERAHKSGRSRDVAALEALRAEVERLAAQGAGGAEPVAFGVFWQIDGTESLQFPVSESLQSAEADKSMYAECDQAALTVRPLYATPPQPAAPMGATPEFINELLDEADWWAGHVDVDHAPMPLRKYLERKIAAMKDANHDH